jgi:hypothetical protein
VIAAKAISIIRLSNTVKASVINAAIHTNPAAEIQTNIFSFKLCPKRFRLNDSSMRLQYRNHRNILLRTGNPCTGGGGAALISIKRGGPTITGSGMAYPCGFNDIIA